MDKGQIHRGRGLVDLIAGVTPTFLYWGVDPTDAANITDGDPTTHCTTGSKVSGSGYSYAHFEWDLGGVYDVLPTGAGGAYSTGTDPQLTLYAYDGSQWGFATSPVAGFTSGTIYHFPVISFRCSKMRLAMTCSSAGTTTPNIREFHLWRL
jgi:hypothetical protein